MARRPRAAAALEPLAGFVKLSRDTTAARRNPRAQSEQASDALAIGCRQPLAGVATPLGQPVHPQSLVRVHRLDNGPVSGSRAIAEPSAVLLLRVSCAIASDLCWLAVMSAPNLCGGATGNPRIGSTKKVLNRAGSTGFRIRRSLAYENRETAARPDRRRWR